MPPKNGLKTTEFWLTVAVNLAALGATLASVLPPRWAAITGTVVTGLYALARGWAKSQPAVVPVVTAPPGTAVVPAPPNPPA